MNSGITNSKQRMIKMGKNIKNYDSKAFGYANINILPPFSEI